MPEAIPADLTRLVGDIEKKGAALDVGAFARITSHVSKYFKVKSDEVAVFVLTQGGNFLRFVVPEKLGKMGDIPMTSSSSLAVRTARERKAEVLNNFASARHPTVFEAVPLGQQRGEPIQKIMSAPIAAENKVIGVVQVSRKGKSVTTAGADFSPKDLTDLEAISQLLGRCLKFYPIA